MLQFSKKGNIKNHWKDNYIVHVEHCVWQGQYVNKFNYQIYQDFDFLENITS